MKDPLLSIIVPVYRVEDYLDTCVRSVLEQSLGNFELILVDDGSPDRCGQMCDQYAVEDARVRVIHKENGGLSSARNAGLDVARGEYVGFVDSDDFIHPEMYAQMLALAQREQVPMVCAGRMDYEEETGTQTPGLCPEQETVLTGEAFVNRMFRWQGFDSAAWDKIYKRELFSEIRYPEGRVVEDVPTTYRIALRAGKVALCPQHFYSYRHRPESITTSRKLTEKTFHFWEHGKMVWQDVRENYPELLQSARFLYCRSLLFTMETVAENRDTESRKRFCDKEKQLRRELCRNLPQYFREGSFSRREGAEALLLALGLYTPLRRLYYAVRKRPL